jgi:phosphate transport system substrate-binding protein
MSRFLRVFAPLVIALGTFIGTFAVAVPPAGAADQINGSGSTWSQIAVDQWRADVARRGLSVNYQGLGSSAGRQFYIQAQSDFAVSEIPFQPASYNREGVKLYDEIQAASKRPYAYMPIVAGGTSIMYHLDINGKRIRDLHLSGQTIAKIFTGGITNWADPAIKHDDGRHFPSLRITPVVRQDGSGTSAQISTYFSVMFPSIWNPFCSKALNLPSPCPPTSLYPYFGASKAQSGSDGVANYVAAPYNNGAVTYVEYGYALQRGFPVASVLNQGGYYRQPTAENVAIALTRARINPDRTQVLNNVYTNPDPRSYPISSYSYMIVPTTTAAPMTTGKGNTLGQFILYFLCTGQQKAKQLGYSPLPANLVQFGFEAESKIPGAPKPPPLSQCANPTITGKFIAGGALPSADEKAGAVRAPLSGGGGSSSGGSGGSGAVTQSDASTTNNTAAAATDTGAAVTGDDGTAIDGEAAAARKANSVTAVSKAQDDVPMGVYLAIVVLILAVAFAPPAFALALRKRRS